MSELTRAECTSVLIADDHPFMRRGLVEAIEEEPDLRVIAEVGDGRAALERTSQLLPNVAILDIDMPVLTGLDIARRIFGIAASGRRRAPYAAHRFGSVFCCP